MTPEVYVELVTNLVKETSRESREEEVHNLNSGSTKGSGSILQRSLSGRMYERVNVSSLTYSRVLVTCFDRKICLEVCLRTQ